MMHGTMNVKIIMVMSRDQNAGRGYGIKIDNNSFARVEGFKYLGINLRNRNYI
jgi:hypothetical protein